MEDCRRSMGVAVESVGSGHCRLESRVIWADGDGSRRLLQKGAKILGAVSRKRLVEQDSGPVVIIFSEDGKAEESADSEAT